MTGEVVVTVIETSSLGDRSYVITSGSVAAVIDPQRDIDRALDASAELGAHITHVLETHLHNDYVSGASRCPARRVPITWCRQATTSAIRRRG